MPLKVFYSYAHEDSKRRALLEKHLNLLKHQGLIEHWHDRNINAGKEWAQEIDTNLNTADIILLLISPDFVSSEYCYSKEMKRALERHENGTARVIPIILRLGDYEEAPFSKLQALPVNAASIVDRKWHSQDEAFREVAQGIRLIVKELLSEQYVDAGDIHFYREEYDKALEAYQYAASLNPINALAYVGKGRTVMELASKKTFADDKEYVDARDFFEMAISLDPTNAAAYAGKGDALFHLYPYRYSYTYIELDMPVILDAFNQAIHLDPTNEDAYIGKANTFKLFREYEEALASYEEAIKRMPNTDRMLYNYKADMLYELGRYNEALTTYEQVMYEFPHYSYAYGGKGNALYKLERYEEAIEAFDQAISFGYHRPALLYAQKGKVLFELKRYQEALNTCEQALQLLDVLDDETSEVYRLKGKILRIMADKAFEKAEEIDHPF